VVTNQGEGSELGTTATVELDHLLLKLKTKMKFRVKLGLKFDVR
jgi:hypothetical protein